MPQRTPSRHHERQKRKTYEQDHPDLGGYFWQAVLVALFGCLFCAGKGFEEKVENAKSSYTNNNNSNEPSEEFHSRRRHTRGRSIDERSAYGASNRRRSRGGGGGDGVYGDGDGRDERVMDSMTLIPSEQERKGERFGGGSSASDEGVRRWMGGGTGTGTGGGGDYVYEMEEGGVGGGGGGGGRRRRERVRRGDY